MKSQKSLILTLMVLCTLGLNAQTRYLDEVFSNVTKTSNVVYGWNWSVIRTAEDTTGTEQIPGTKFYVDSLVADIYAPAGDTATNRPVVLLSHAGSFLPNTLTGLPLGTKNDSCLIEMCTRLAKRGYVAVSFTYRLGWNPFAADQETRAKGIILAVYKANQDAKALIRFLKTNASTYGVAQDKFILGGSNSGAYVALLAGNLNKPNEINNFKFLDSLGNSFIDTTLWGNYDGFGGLLNNSNNSPGVSSSFQGILSLGGCVGDTSWVEAGEVPVIAFHGVADAGSPYNTAVVIVAATGSPVIEVSGPGDFNRIADGLGNQDLFKGAFCGGVPSTDGNIYEGTYPFYGAGFEPWGWYSASTPLNPTASRARAMAYIDTIMDYFLPRAYRLLIDSTYTDPCVVVDETTTNDVNVEIYPNPSHSDIHIRVNEANQTIKSVELFDVAGKLVRAEEAKNALQHTIRRNGVEHGIYFVKINFTKGEQTFKRIMFE